MNSKNEVAFSIGSSLYCGTLPNGSEDSESRIAEDMWQTMTARAHRGYGVDAEKNADMDELCTREVNELWKFVKLASSVPPASSHPSPLKGVAELVTALTVHESKAREEVKSEVFPTYGGKIRDIIITCCDWVADIDKKDEVAGLIDRTSGYKKIALAAFHLNFPIVDAVISKLVEEGDASTQLAVIKGATKDLQKNAETIKGDRHRDFYTKFSKDAADPYLQLLFAFISSYTFRNP